MCPLERNLYGHSLAGLVWEAHGANLFQVMIRTPIRKGVSIFARRTRIHVCLRRRCLRLWADTQSENNVGEITRVSRIRTRISASDHVYLGCIQREVAIIPDFINQNDELFRRTLLHETAEAAHLAKGSPCQLRFSAFQWTIPGFRVSYGHPPVEEILFQSATIQQFSSLRRLPGSSCSHRFTRHKLHILRC